MQKHGDLCPALYRRSDGSCAVLYFKHRGRYDKRGLLWVVRRCIRQRALYVLQQALIIQSIDDTRDTRTVQKLLYT